MRGDSLYDRIEDDSLADSSLANDSKLNDSVANPRFRCKKTLKDYEFVINENSRFQTSELGKGAYGTVKKVRDLDNGKIYAMKIMNKKAIFEYSTKENLKREITIQKNMFHPHIIRLYTYFEDTENVYLVLEFAENGSLFHYLRRRKTLTEKEAFIFFFQTCLGIDYLHQKKVIHRDLKPENLLLDSEGNIKVCDFGWSVDTNSNRHTFCGTIDYMAPEMIKNLPHDQRLDIWCLGILLYEMLHGHAPFKGRTEQEKTKNISMNSQISFGPNLSNEVVDLVRKILKPAPSDRISLMEIFQHPWMKTHEKIFEIDVMSYVDQQHVQIKESQRPPRKKDINKENPQKEQQQEQQAKQSASTAQSENYLKPVSPPKYMRENMHETMHETNSNSFGGVRENQSLKERSPNIRKGEGLQLITKGHSEKIYTKDLYQDLSYRDKEKSDRLDTLQSVAAIRTVETPQFAMDYKKRSVTSDSRLKQDNPHVFQRSDYRRECSFGTEESQMDGYNHHGYQMLKTDHSSFIRTSIEEEDESFDDFIKRIRSQSQPKPVHTSSFAGQPQVRQQRKDLSYTNPFQAISDSQFKREAVNRKVTAKFGSQFESHETERSFTEEKREVYNDVYLRKEKMEIEPRKMREKPEKEELGFFEKMLISLGCLSREEDRDRSPRGRSKSRKGKKRSAFCV